MFKPGTGGDRAAARLKYRSLSMGRCHGGEERSL